MWLLLLVRGAGAEKPGLEPVRRTAGLKSTGIEIVDSFPSSP
jgi:hypothetical protein